MYSCVPHLSWYDNIQLQFYMEANLQVVLALEIFTLEYEYCESEKDMRECTVYLDKDKGYCKALLRILLEFKSPSDQRGELTFKKIVVPPWPPLH